MKKSNKINLKDATILSDKQMKKVNGGSGPNGINLVDPCFARDKIAACKGKMEGDWCCFNFDGTTYYGACVELPSFPIHCTLAS